MQFLRTDRIGQISGSSVDDDSTHHDPQGWPLLNYTSRWGALGFDEGANTEHATSCARISRRIHLTTRTWLRGLTTKRFCGMAVTWRRDGSLFCLPWKQEVDKGNPIGGCVATAVDCSGTEIPTSKVYV